MVLINFLNSMVKTPTKFNSKRTDIFRNLKLHDFLILLLVGKKMLTNYCQEEFNSQFLPEKNQGRKHQVIVYVRHFDVHNVTRSHVH